MRQLRAGKESIVGAGPHAAWCADGSFSIQWTFELRRVRMTLEIAGAFTDASADIRMRAASLMIVVRGKNGSRFDAVTSHVTLVPTREGSMTNPPASS